MRKSLWLLLMAIFVVQSTLVLADIHQFHQRGIKHLAFDHVHAPDPNNANLGYADFGDAGLDINNPNLDSKVSTTTAINGDKPVSFDCHHCCHCHGSAHGFALPSILCIDCDRIPQIQSDDYLAVFYPPIPEKQFRPPRS